MARILLEANDLAMMSVDGDDVGSEELQELEEYLAALESEIENENIRAESFNRFVDLPAELRGLVYEIVAADSTIRLEEVASWREWPSICFASRWIYDEALPVVYRCSTFEARVRYLDFSQLIQFAESLPPICLSAMSCNERITILFDAIPNLEAIQMYSLLQPWLSVCWSLAANGNEIQWFYAAPLNSTLDLRVLRLSNISAILHHFGYDALKDVYAMIEDEHMKDEVAGMLLAVRSSAKWAKAFAAEMG